MSKPTIKNDNTSWGEEANKLISLSRGITTPILESAKVLWLGTSIPAGCTYPANSCNELGASLTNMAMASSAVRNKNSNGSYSGIDWKHYAYSLSQTSAEKEYIIANWATIKSSLSGSPPATLDSTAQGIIRNSSYEVKLTPHLDAALFVLDHGYNDRIASESTSDYKTIPADYKDRNYFIGAMNFIIDKILTANPRAKICIIGHYENTWLSQISEAQRIIANYWQIPMLNTYEYTRWSDKIINGSSMLLNWIPDGTHPYTDLTGQSDLLLDRVVVNFLRSIV